MANYPLSHSLTYSMGGPNECRFPAAGLEHGTRNAF